METEREREIDGMKRKDTKSNQPNERQVADEMNKNQTKPNQANSKHFNVN